jgi:hypothetical protein
MTDKGPTTRHAFRFQRMRFETLDVVIEGAPGTFGHALALTNALKIADRKRTVWQPESEPYAHFMQAKVEETIRAGVPSEIKSELHRRGSGKQYVLLELDRQETKGMVHWLGVKLRKSKQADVSIAVDLITALMKAADISEIVDTDA